MQRWPDPTLVVLVGPGASGKSTWAAEHFGPDEVLSSDRLRAVVGEGEHDLAASADAFAVLDQMLAVRMRRRLTTVVDTLGLDADRRATWRRLAAEHGVRCVAVAFDTTAAECRRRNGARPHRIPVAVLTRQLGTWRQVRPLLAAEAFDEVVTVAGTVGSDAGTPAPASRATPPDGPTSPAVATPLTAAPPPAGMRSNTGDSRTLRFGLHVSSFPPPAHDGEPGLAERLGAVAAQAEAVGFDSIWVMDHLRQIPQVGRAWDDMPESVTTQGWLAARTSRVTVGCLVHGVTYRNVALLGKAVATLDDVLSGGRAWCGLGAGWFEAEHRAYGWAFPSAAERLDRLEDALQLLPLLWGPGSPSFEGKVVSVPDAMCYPRPLRGRVPLLVGGQGERRTLRLAARYADACNLFGDPDTVRHKVAVLHRHCAEVGRDPAAVDITHLSTTLVAADRRELDAEAARLGPSTGIAAWRSRVNAGTVEDQVLRVRRLQEAGVDHVIVSLPGLWDSPALRRFGEVIRAFR